MGSLFGRKSGPANGGFDRKALMPTLRRREHHSLMRIAAEAQGAEWSDFVRTPVAGGLDWYVAHDSPANVVLLTSKGLEDLGISPDEARRIALENLRSRWPGKKGLLQPKPGLPLFLNAWHDYYSSSQILLPECVGGLGFQGRPVALVPSREGMMLVDSASEEALIRGLMVAQEAIQSQNGLSGQLLGWNGSAWEDFELPSEHPARKGARINRLIEELLASQAQEARMQALKQVVVGGQPRPRPLYASMGLILPGVSGPEDAEPHSVAVWVTDATTILPKADRIQLGRVVGDSPQVVGEVAWARLEPLIGTRLLPLPYDPPCFLASGPLEDEELAPLLAT